MLEENLDSGTFEMDAHVTQQPPGQLDFETQQSKQHDFSKWADTPTDSHEGTTRAELNLQGKFSKSAHFAAIAGFPNQTGQNQDFHLLNTSASPAPDTTTLPTMTGDNSIALQDRQLDSGFGDGNNYVSLQPVRTGEVKQSQTQSFIIGDGLTRQVSSVLEGTVHQQPGGRLIAQTDSHLLSKESLTTLPVPDNLMSVEEAADMPEMEGRATSQQSEQNGPGSTEVKEEALYTYAYEDLPDDIKVEAGATLQPEQTPGSPALEDEPQYIYMNSPGDTAEEGQAIVPNQGQPEPRLNVQDYSEVITNEHALPADDKIDIEQSQGVPSAYPLVLNSMEGPREQNASKQPIGCLQPGGLESYPRNGAGAGSMDAELQANETNLEENLKKTIALAAEVGEYNRPSVDDILSIVREYKTPSYSSYSDDESCSLGKCCAPCSYCKCGFVATKERCSAVHKGVQEVVDVWSDGVTPLWKLAFVIIRIFIYLCLLTFTVGSFIYHFAEERSVIPFDGVSFGLVVIGKLVALTHAFLYICRHHQDIRLNCQESCCRIRDLCRRAQRGYNPNEAEENQNDQDEAEEYVLAMKRKLRARKGKGALFRNFSEVLLTIVNDGIGTVVFIMSLYSFVGGQHYALFYVTFQWGHFFSFGRLVSSSILLLFATHFLRMLTIGKNIYKLNKKIKKTVKDLDLLLPNTFSTVLFSFQWRLVAHVALSSVFQLYAIFALSWKLIQDHCIPVSPSVPSVNTNGSMLSTNNITSNNTMLPFMCDIPHFANGYTIYNILYVAFAPTVLGYIAYFICNAPSFVEYMKLIATSSYHHMKKFSEDENGVLEDACDYPVIELLKIFCSDIDNSFSDNDLKGVMERAQNMGKWMVTNLNKDAPLEGKCYFITALYQLFQSAFFLPACVVGVLHIGLFAIHTFFMSCTVKGCFGANILNALINDATGELLVVLIPLVILFLLASFPGPWLGVFWICVILLVIIAVSMIVGAVLAGIGVIVGGIVTVIGTIVSTIVLAIGFTVLFAGAPIIFILIIACFVLMCWCWCTDQL